MPPPEPNRPMEWAWIVLAALCLLIGLSVWWAQRF
jgi:hypothetical protein